MTNKQAYLSDLSEIEMEIKNLLGMVPVGKTKKELQQREQAEEIVGRIRATIGCMKNDYIPTEF